MSVTTLRPDIQERRKIAADVLGREPANQTEIDLCFRIHETEAELERIGTEKMYSETNNVSAIHTGKTSVGNQHLVELAMNAGLEKYMIVAFWSDGSVRTGWSAQMKMSDMAFGLMCLEKRIKDVCVGGYES